MKELFKIFQPLFIALILQYFKGTISLNTALIYAGVISLLAALGGILHHPYYNNAYKFGMKIRLALTGIIYRKVKSFLFAALAEELLFYFFSY